MFYFALLLWQTKLCGTIIWEVIAKTVSLNKYQLKNILYLKTNSKFGSWIHFFYLKHPLNDSVCFDFNLCSCKMACQPPRLWLCTLLKLMFPRQFCTYEEEMSSMLVQTQKGTSSVFIPGHFVSSNLYCSLQFFSVYLSFSQTAAGSFTQCIVDNNIDKKWTHSILMGWHDNVSFFKLHLNFYHGWKGLTVVGEATQQDWAFKTNDWQNLIVYDILIVVVINWLCMEHV